MLLARADAGYQDIALEPIDLTETVRDVCAEMRLVTQASGIQLHTSAPPFCPVTADAQAIRRLLVILLESRRDHSTGHCHVEPV